MINFLPEAQKPLDKIIRIRNDKGKRAASGCSQPLKHAKISN